MYQTNLLIVRMRLFPRIFVGLTVLAAGLLSGCKHRSEEGPIPVPDKTLVILSPQTSGKRYALDGQTGSIKWVLDRSSASSGKLVVANRSMYLHAPLNNPLNALKDTMQLFKNGNIQPNLLILDATSGATTTKMNTLLKPGYSVGCCTIWQLTDFIGIYQNMAIFVQRRSEIEIPYVNTVYAFDISQNRISWKLETNADGVKLNDGKVYIMRGPENRTDVLDVETGELVSKIPRFAIAPIGQGMALVSNENKLLAIQEQTNSVEWTFTSPEPMAITPNVLSSDMLYVTSSRGTLYALNRKTGAKKWEFKADNKSEQFTGLTATDSDVYFSRPDGQIYALDRATGALTWKVMTGDGIREYPRKVAVKSNFVYILVGEKTLLMLDKKSGEKRWEFTSPDLTNPILDVFDQNELDF